MGYESRASHFYSSVSTTSQKSTALVFGSQQLLGFKDNESQFEKMGFNFVQASTDKETLESSLQNLFAEIIRLATEANESEVRILIDISSMTRQMISLLSFYAASTPCSCTIICDYVYSPAQFGELPNVEGPILSDGPVTEKLAGWCSVLGAPCGVILGIGYEPDLALGVIEDLEAGEVWAFRPTNSDVNYEDAITRHNRGLDQNVRAANTIRYSIYDPYALYVSLNQLVRSARHEYRTIIVPFGPKIFSLCATIATLSNYPEIGLWRVSAGPNLTPVDRIPTGEIVGLRVSY